jgi:hypothetical protein
MGHHAGNLTGRRAWRTAIGAAALALLWASAATAGSANDPFADAAKGEIAVGGVDVAASDGELALASDTGEALNPDPDTLTGRPAAPVARPAPVAATPSPTREDGPFEANGVPLDSGAPYFNADWPTFWPPRFLP